LVNFAAAVVCKRCGCQFQNFAQNNNQTYAYDQYSSSTNTYDQSNAYSQQPYASPYKSQSEAGSGSNGGGARMAVGALTAIGGLIATAVSYSSASDGGTYYVFWGLIVVGAINFLLGLNASLRDS
jgi:hypothetical protein